MPLLAQALKKSFQEALPLTRSFLGTVGEQVQKIREPGKLFESNPITKSIYGQIKDSYYRELIGHVPHNKLLYEAGKAGITEGSKASTVIFRAREGTATTQELAELSPTQQTFIPRFQQAWEDLANLVGLPRARRISDYATHLIISERPAGIDLTPLYQFLPKNLQARFLQPRKGAPNYLEDINKAFSVYKAVVLRKHYREPYLDNIINEYNQLATDRSLQLRARNYINDWLGRRPEGGTTQAAAYAFRRRFYHATLFANIASSTTNLSQLLTALYPEIGGVNMTRALRLAVTPKGKALFKISGHPLGYRDMGMLDIFQRVERTNQYIAFLGGYLKNLTERGIKGLPNQLDDTARRVGLDTASKTQFFDAHINSPEMIRRHPLVTMFMGFPLRMAELIGGWVKKGEYNKLVKFATVTTLLGGPYAWTEVPILRGLVAKSPELNDFLTEWEMKYSLAGGLGINLAPKFGLGVPIPQRPFLYEPILEAWRLLNSLGPDGFSLQAKERFANKYGIAPGVTLANGFIGMYPWIFVKGGLQIQKLMKMIDNLERGHTITPSGQPGFPTNEIIELQRALLGQPLDEAIQWRLQGNVISSIDENLRIKKQEILSLYGQGEPQLAKEYQLDWNQRHPDTPIAIKPGEVKRSIRYWNAFAPQRARMKARRILRPMFMGRTEAEQKQLKRFWDDVGKIVNEDLQEE